MWLPEPKKILSEYEGRNMSNKYRARRTYSSLCKRWFSSSAEAVRGEELCLLEKAGQITDLRYHQKFRLSTTPKVDIEVDFIYSENGQTFYEDCKGKETREYRVKRIWLKQQQGIDIILSGKGR